MLYLSKMTTIENNILLVKTSIFESVNRTLFTASGVSLALLASTQTNLYIDETYKLIIKAVGLSMLTLIVIYGFYNVSDYKSFIDNYKTKDDNDVISIYTEYNIMILYCFLVLLCVVIVSNVSMMM